MIYHEELEISEENFKLIGRIFTYVKPYWITVSLSLLFLLLTTGGQLLLPVIIQRTVDENLRPSWVRSVPSLHSELIQWDQRIEGSEIRIGDYYYYPENLAGSFLKSEDNQRSAQQSGQSTAQAFDLYFLLNTDNIDTNILTAISDRIEEGNGYIVISEDNYKQLNRDQKQALRLQDWDGVRQKVIFYVVLLVVVFIFSFLQLFLMSLAGQNIIKDLRLQLYTHTTKQKLKYLQNQQVGRLVTRVSNDVETINEFFTNVLSAIVSDAVMMIGVIVTLFVLNPRLGLVTLLILPPVCLLLYIFQNKARKAYRKVRSLVSAVNAYLSEHFSGVAVVQAFVQEQKVRREFDDRNTQLFKANLGELHVFAIFRPLVDMLATLSIALIIYAGASFFLEGLLSLGILIAFINLIERFYQPVQDMAEKFTLLQSALAGSERVFALLDDNHNETTEGSYSPTKEKVRGAITFDNVHFSYIQGEPVLQGISFTCEPGERIALVGHTGSGKTTIANIITRLWEQDSGSITLDGIDIREIPLPELRNLIQIIQQEVSFFHLSLRDNLLLGGEMTDDQLFAILDEVQAGDFIRALPEGLDTVIAENTSNFSVGQLQLLSFARLLVQNPRVIIMDEATANIDTKTEKKVQKAIDRIIEGRTSIVIAHRLSTIKHADKILVLAKGTVVESGNHEELMQKGGLYSVLQEIQTK